MIGMLEKDNPSDLSNSFHKKKMFQLGFPYCWNFNWGVYMAQKSNADQVVKN